MDNEKDIWSIQGAVTHDYHKLVCTIDPGLSGAIMFSDSTGKVWYKMKMIIDDNGMVNSKMMFEKLFDGEYTRDLLLNTNTVVIEHLHAIFGIAAGSNWKLGVAFGTMYSFATQMFDDVVLVRPKAWQKEVIIPEDIQYNKKGKKDNKKTSIAAAMRLYPEEDLRPTERSKIWDHNYCDCALIAHWYFKTNPND